MSNLATRLAEAIDGYDVNAHQIITSPGRYEAEPIYVPYFHSFELDGDGDTAGDVNEGGAATLLPIDADDRALFPDLLSPEDGWIVLTHSSDGFIGHRLFQDESQAERYLASFESDAADDSNQYAEE